MTDAHSIEVTHNVGAFGPDYLLQIQNQKVTVPTTISKAAHIADLQGVLNQVKQLGQAIV